MEKKNSVMDNEVVTNQFSVSEQEEIRAALEAKYNSAEEAVEQDLLRAQFDRVHEENVDQDILVAQFDAVENVVEDTSEDFAEIENDSVEEDYSFDNDDSNDWSSVNDNPYYNDNLDMDQQSPEFWDNLWTIDNLLNNEVKNDIEKLYNL